MENSENTKRIYDRGITRGQQEDSKQRSNAHHLVSKLSCSTRQTENDKRTASSILSNQCWRYI